VDTKADNRRHHYVSRFYLKAFASGPGQIHVFNIDRGESFLDASLKTQGYRRGFHAAYPGLEDLFSGVESDLAPVIRRVVAERRPPRPGTYDRSMLDFFVAAQEMRTARNVADADSTMRAMLRAALRPLSDDGRKRFFEKHGPPPGGLGMAMAALPHLLKGFADLRAAIVVAGAGVRFTTSDHPVFTYNQYCEGVQEFGTTGIAQRGVQVFTPLSPEVLLLLFDGDVYKVGRKGAAVVECLDDCDAAVLNGMQFISAERNVFFSEREDAGAVARIATEYAKLRQFTQRRTTEFVRVDNARKRIIQSHATMPNLRLDLSFVSVRREARCVPRTERVRTYRPEALRRLDRKQPRPLPPGLRPGMLFKPINEPDGP